MRAGLVVVLSSLLLLFVAGPATAARNGRIYFSAPSRGELATGCGVASVSTKGTRERVP